MRLGALAGAVAAATTIAAIAAAAGDAPLVWRANAESPRRFTPPASLAALYAACGAPDLALAEVAARTATHHVEAGALPNVDDTAFALRAAGDPHPSPRVFGITGKGLDQVDVSAKLSAWAASTKPLGVRRCGLARAEQPDGRGAVAAVTVDAIADLAPLPATARVGQWLTIDGSMLVPTSEAKVIVLGPRGAPKTILASLSPQGRVRATFAANAPGPWLVQVLATVAMGPRPALEAIVHVGVAPPAQFSPIAAPGEDAAVGAVDDVDAMTRMINAARASDGSAPLRRDKELDRIALAHAVAMKQARAVGHDVGDGDPTARVRIAGAPTGRVLGENVASAQTPTRAHRALWASPSHRSNLLYAAYSDLGVGVVRDAEGTVWVVELFRN